MVNTIKTLRSFLVELRIFYEEAIVGGNCSIRIAATKAETEGRIRGFVIPLGSTLIDGLRCASNL